MPGMIRTVIGDIEPSALGFTLMHEHVLCDITPPALRGRADLDLPVTLENRFDIDYGRNPNIWRARQTDPDLLTAELGFYKKAGGSALLDLTVGGLSPQPDAIADIARKTGLHIILGCGHYVDEFQATENRGRSIDDFAVEMIKQVTEGAWGTRVRAGIIGEIGCSVPWTDLERRVMRAAIEAQKATGAALSIHPGASRDAPFEIVAFLREAGAHLERTIMGHIDRTLFEHDEMLRLAASGVVLEFDLFGCEHAFWPLGDIDMPNDGQRIGYLKALIAAGHAGQVLCSHDICRLTRLKRYGGHGFAHLIENVIPMMRKRGIEDSHIDRIFVETPRLLLTFMG